MDTYELSRDHAFLATETRIWVIARRCFDLLAGSTLILIASPLMIAVAVAVRLDSHGPSLFRQRRLGYRQREFTLFKFRSMRNEADEKRHREYVAA